MLPTLSRNSHASFPNSLDSLFRSFFGPWSDGLATGNRVPPINLIEEDGQYVLEAELPGYALADVQLEVHGDRVMLSGSREDVTPESVTFRRKERQAQSFERHLQLPTEVAAEQVSACLRNGLLRVVLPVAAAAQPRQITVNG
ncbi:MAG: Hsp20/alpha crystallin family protein [Planctomycetota bacterium]